MVGFMFLLVFAGIIVLMFHILVEINTLEKKTENLTKEIGKYYEKIT